MSDSPLWNALEAQRLARTADRARVRREALDIAIKRFEEEKAQGFLYRWHDVVEILRGLQEEP